MLKKHLIAKTLPMAREGNIILNGNCRVTVLNECLFRVEQSDNGFVDEASQAVWYRDLGAVEYKHSTKDSILTVSTSKATIRINLTDIRKSESMDNKGNLGGTVRTLDTFGPGAEDVVARDIPLGYGIMSRSGVAVYDDSGTLLLDSKGQLCVRPKGAADLYVFAYGKDYLGAIKGLYAICGAPPIIPRWALGNWWSRYHAYTEQEYINLLDTFEEENVPLSVGVIDMDWHYVDIDKAFGIKDESGWTGLSWDKNLFPDSKRFLSEVKSRGLKTALNLHPADGIRWFEDCYPNMARAMGVDPKSKQAIKFDIADPKFVNNYLEAAHHPLEDEGVDFWWIDWQQGTDSGLAGLDPLWALNHYHYMDNNHRTGEGLILSRYAGLGSHRYPLGFSGDTIINWSFLDFVPYFTATASNIGYTWWSHDIGGHQGGIADDELYIRWLQFGAFSPINRLHSTLSDMMSKEPWSYSENIRHLAKHLLRLRHKLVPYVYTYSHLTHTDAIPLVMPMYYLYPNEDNAYKYDNQYMFGHELLVAPITTGSVADGLASVDVWLPNGKWTDFLTNDVYEGGRVIKVIRDLGLIPVFAKSGAIIPLSNDLGNGCPNPAYMDICVYSGNGSFDMIETQGKDKLTTHFGVKESGDSMELVIEASGGLDITRDYRVCFSNISDGKVSVTVNGKSLPAKLRRNRCLQVLLSRISSKDRVRITVLPQAATKLQTIKNSLAMRLQKLCLPNNPKNELWNRIKLSKDAKAIIDIIKSSPLLGATHIEYLLEVAG